MSKPSKGTATATPTDPGLSPRVQSQDTDPLELHKLSLSYDYLMFKIKDYIRTLTDQTYESVVQKQDRINHDYFDKQLNLPSSMKRLTNYSEPAMI